jgi:hypothetical protein
LATAEPSLCLLLLLLLRVQRLHVLLLRHMRRQLL